MSEASKRQRAAAMPPTKGRMRARFGQAAADAHLEHLRIDGFEKEYSMRAPDEPKDRQLDERAIHSLSDQSGVPRADVRTLFRHERARLGMGAKVHSFLAVLTASIVRGMLRRMRERRERAQGPPEVEGPLAPRELSRVDPDGSER